MLIHHSSKLGEGSRVSREQGLQRLHVIPRTSIARMASHPLGNSPCLLCTGWAAICDGHRAALPRESAVEGIEIVEEAKGLTQVRTVPNAGGITKCL